jgi:hypothetical protein
LASELLQHSQESHHQSLVFCRPIFLESEIHLFEEVFLRSGMEFVIVWRECDQLIFLGRY